MTAIVRHLCRLLGLSVLFGFVALAARADVTINFGAKVLFDSSGSLLPDGTLFILVADTTHNGFGTAQAGNFSAGSFLGGDDLILGIGFTEDGLGSGAASNLTLAGGLDTNDPLAVLWFPGVTSSASFSLTNGASYGLFTTSSPSSGAAWLVPSDGANINIEELNLVGTAGVMSGRASLTAIPEPATYAAIFGGGVLGIGLLHRRRTARR